MGFAAKHTATKYIAAFDIGSGTTRMDVYALQDGKLSDEPVYSRNVKTVSDKSGHADSMVALLKGAEESDALQGGNISAIVPAFPGRIVDNNVVPGSAPNMQGFDNVDLVDYYTDVAKQAFGGRKCAVLPANDAVVMFKGIASEICNNRELSLLDTDGNTFNANDIKNKHVAYFGFGGGLGNGYGVVKADGSVDVTSDHGQKCFIKASPEEIALVEHANSVLAAAGKETYPTKDGKVMAEALTGTVPLKAMLGVTDLDQHLDPDKPEQREKLEMAGKATARLAATIQNGNYDDATNVGWSPAAQEAAKKTQIYLFSGGVFKGEAGKAIIDSFNAERNRLTSLSAQEFANAIGSQGVDEAALQETQARLKRARYVVSPGDKEATKAAALSAVPALTTPELPAFK